LSGCHKPTLNSQEARAWYDDVRPELGDRFAKAVDATIKRIAEYPPQFPVVYRGRRRAGVPRFPYSIFFDRQEHRILVIACFHAKRSPKRWERR
jgi:toxin ParE1/3/4